MSANLFRYFRSSLPADTAKLFIEDATGRLNVSYDDMLSRTAQFAGELQALGVRHGDRVAVQVEKSAESLLLYLAVLRAGGVYLPLNPAYVATEVRYFLSDAEPAVLICRPDDETVMRELAGDLQIGAVRTLGTGGDGTFLEGVGSRPVEFDDAVVRPDDLAAILYTSGTTGRSKGAMLTHANLRSNAETLCHYWRFTADDRLIHALPIFHTHGLFVATNVMLGCGGTMILLPRFDAREIIRHLPRATVLMGVPTFYMRLLDESEFTRGLVANMRLFISGSAPLSAETHREFSARVGHAILERYGMTETNMNTSNPYAGDRIPGSVGLPLPDIEIRIADAATGAALPEGPGSIEVRGPNVFKGYWRMPEKTALEFRADGFFITGDLGYRDEQGYLFIAGRSKDLIISGGFNIYPAEVENAIDALKGVAESAVIGLPHPYMGEAVVAVIARSANSDLTEEDISTLLEGELARYKRPRQFLFVESLPRNAMGKVQKSVLRNEFKSLFEPA